MTDISYRGILNDFAFEYADEHRDRLVEMQSAENYIQKFKVTHKLLEELYLFAAKEGLEVNTADIAVSEDVLRIRLKALIARNIWGNEAYYPIIAEDDKMLQQAISAFKSEAIILP